jgi:Arc/MetJ-type ribon-helix-helix transcriptional regulator
MEVHFVPDPDQEVFIRQGIANGRYQTAEDAVRDAMSRWEERERTRLELLATLDEAEAIWRRDGIPTIRMERCPCWPTS